MTRTPRSRTDGRRLRPLGPRIARSGSIIALGFALIAAGAGYWQVFAAPGLLARPDNVAVIAAARSTPRGTIYDRDGNVLASNKRDANGEPYRVYADRALSGVVGYASRRFGTAGLERAFEAQLVGILDPDPVRDLLRKFQSVDAAPQDLTTSLSLDLQRIAVDLLGSDRGAVVAIDPRNGDVIALASTPTFDANAVADPASSQASFATLQADPARPLLPRATQGRYVPGSVFKIVTALAALGSGAVSADTTFAQQPQAEIDGLLVEGFRVRDGHHTATGRRALDFFEATEVSCNVWYALAGLAAGGDKLDEYARRLGFGAPLPFDLATAPSQITGSDPDGAGGGPVGGGFADAVELANAAYGQAETIVTPLQMALVAATVANGGIMMQPRLVTGFSGDGTGRAVDPITLQRVVDGGTAAEIRDAMVQAVNGRLGRGFTSGAAVPGVTTAGKSGTAELGGSGEPNSWFIGFAPAEAPTIAIAVIVEQGGRGGERAAPLAGRLLRAWFAGSGT